MYTIGLYLVNDKLKIDDVKSYDFITINGQPALSIWKGNEIYTFFIDKIVGYGIVEQEEM